MLVLSRKSREAIVIGGSVVVSILEVKGDRVKLGIAAPAKVPVHREEVRQRIGDCTPLFRFAECA